MDVLISNSALASSIFHMTEPGLPVLFTVHNTLFTFLSISLLIPKLVLSIQGQSAIPNVLDLVYGVFIALS